jgi:nitrite reductase/ring-hydroxylating ferredoxin subunit
MSDPTEFSRRRFVRSFTFGTAFSILMGRPWRGTLLAAIQPAAGGAIGLLRVKLSDYPALQDVLGSVRLGVTPIDGNLPVGAFYPIIINRAPNNRFYALDSRCQHAGCVVPIYLPDDVGVHDEFGGAILCPCHGSTYAIDGALISNGPAPGPLNKYTVTFDGANMLTVQVPNLGYQVDATIVDTDTTSRLQLDFPTFAAVEYEVLFRARIRDPWRAVPFSMTVDGAADQLSVIGDDLPASVFVDRTTPTGFFSVAIKILDLSMG